MKAKSIEYRLLYALKVIQLDPNARVLFALSTRESATKAWHTLMNLPGKPSGLTYSLQGREVRHESGGLLVLRDIEDPYGISGMQVSHAWVDEYAEQYQRDYVACRIRTPIDRLPTPEPSGLYDPWKVTRIEDY